MLDPDRNQNHKPRTMKELLTVIAYHNGDVSLLSKLLAYIKTMGGCKDFPCVLFPDSQIPVEQRKEIKEQADEVFGYVEAWSMKVPAELKGHKAANQVFLAAMIRIREMFRFPFLWLEPDCVPIVRTWLEDLCSEYYAQPKRFMGCVIKVNRQINSVRMPDYMMAGCAVYPSDAVRDLTEACKGEFAWDVSGANVTVPRCANTPLIQHFWGRQDAVPTFKIERETKDPENVYTLDFIHPDTVLFHRCKDGTLIDCLTANAFDENRLPGAKRPARKNRATGKQPALPAQPAVVETVADKA
jgi:hypothetical protein